MLTGLSDLVISTEFDFELAKNFSVSKMKTMTHLLPYFDNVEPSIIEGFVRELLMLPRLEGLEIGTAIVSVELQESSDESNLPVVKALSEGRRLALLGIRFSPSKMKPDAILH